MSITLAAARTDACTSSVTATVYRCGRPPRCCANTSRAVTNALRLAAEPPDTNTPPASAGKPARSASHRSAWFSAAIAPAPASQLPPKIDDALTTRSNIVEATEGAVGT